MLYDIKKLTASALLRATAKIEAQGYTKASLARHVGEPVSTVIGWFNREIISLSTLATIANLVNVHPGILLLGPEEIGLLIRCRKTLYFNNEEDLSKELQDLLDGGDL